MKISNEFLVGFDAAGLLLSGAQAASQVAGGPWQTAAGAVAGVAASFLMHVGLDSFLRVGEETFKLSHLASSVVFGILGPAEARFSLLNRVVDLFRKCIGRGSALSNIAQKYVGRGFSLHICSPFLNGFNLGFMGCNLFMSNAERKKQQPLRS